MPTLSRRMIVAAACAATLLLVPFAQPGRAHMCTPDSVVPVPGMLLVPRASGLARFSLSERVVEQLPVLPSTGVVSQVARSQDGSRLAVARFSRPEGDPIGGADILITGPNGGDSTDRIERTRPGEMIGAPAWHPRGGVVFERSTLAGGLSSARIDWRRDDESIITLVDRGSAPSLSPDGSQLAFVDTTRGDRLLLRNLDSGETSVLVENDDFLAIAFPRFSPNGEWLAFAAVGEPVVPPSPSATVGMTLGPASVVAHGIPWDAWAVHASSGELRRLSSFYDDDPAVAWSPDGRWVAMFAGEVVTLVAFDGSASYCVLSTGGYGGFEWI
jgi:dipeptidyl aminopeptidase/acylaminoacyl peptidase